MHPSYSDQGAGLKDDYDHYDLLRGARINSTRNWMQVLYGLMRTTGVVEAVEIGVMHGLTTSMLAHAIRMNGGGRLTAVDIEPAHLEIARKRVEQNGLKDIVRFVQGDSHAVPTHAFEALFIDGDHSYEGCSGDWEHWSPQCVPGGWVAIHDTLDARIQRFLGEAHRFKGWQVIDFPGDCGMAILRRNG